MPMYDNVATLYNSVFRRRKTICMRLQCGAVRRAGFGFANPISLFVGIATKEGEKTYVDFIYICAK